jgi:hypothetical protein
MKVRACVDKNNWHFTITRPMVQAQMKQAILLLLSLFATQIAQAMPIISGDGTESCSLSSGSNCTVQTISPPNVYQSPDPLGQGALWISYADTGRPGTVTATPGYVATFYEHFTADLGNTLDLQVWADNWVEILLDGTSVFSTTETAMFRPGNQAVVNHVFTSSGLHTLAIDAYQDGSLESPPGNPFGVMYSGTLNQVPEPATLALLGIGIAGMCSQRGKRIATT